MAETPEDGARKPGWGRRTAGFFTGQTQTGRTPPGLGRPGADSAADPGGSPSDSDTGAYGTSDYDPGVYSPEGYDPGIYGPEAYDPGAPYAGAPYTGEGGAVVVDDPGADPMVDPGYDMVDRNWVRYRPAWGGFLRFVIFVGLVVAAVVWARGRVYEWVDAQVAPGGEPGEEVELTIPSGASVNEVAAALDSAEVISNATVYRYWLRCEGELTITGFLGCEAEKSFQAGDYRLRTGMDFESATAVLDQGPLPEVFQRITIPEGMRWTQMSARLLRENPLFDLVDLERAFVLVEANGDYLPEDAPVRTMEGLLFPATYDVAEDDLGDEYSLLRRMSDEFDNRLARLLADPGPHPDVTELGLGPYEVTVVASLIEEEARVAEERPKIARVIYNRLAIGEMLGIDASACYAANKPCDRLTTADLQNPSPWNTRAVAGLPPTPISAPGEASLRAALQPAEGDWLFYVLTDEGGVEGAHHFSTTLEEHLQYVEICRQLGYC